jgi:hypothetical protein
MISSYRLGTKIPYRNSTDVEMAVEPMTGNSWEYETTAISRSPLPLKQSEQTANHAGFSIRK